MNFILYRRLFSYLKPNMHLAIAGMAMIFLLTFSGAASLFMLKPIFDGILSKTKEELIAQENRAKPGEALRFAKSIVRQSGYELKQAVKGEKSFKQAKISISSSFNDYLKSGPVGSILIFVVLVIAVGIAIKTMSEYARRIIFLALNLRTMARVRTDMYDKVMTFSMPFFNEHKAGKLLNRVVGEVNIIQDIIITNASGIITNVVMVVFYFAMILWIDWKLTLILIFCFMPMLFLLDKLARFLKGFQHKLQEIIGEMLSTAQEAFAGIRLVIGSSTQKFEADRYKNAVKRLQKTSFKIGRYDLLAAPISELTTTIIGLGIVVFALKTRVMNTSSDMTSGDFVVYVAFMFSMMKPIKDLNSLFVSLQRGMVIAGRVFEILDTPTTIPEKINAVELKTFTDGIEFKNVTFGYLKDAPVLKNLSFKIKKGEIIALVGPSGGGKTTLADMLPRLYDPDIGSVNIDGYDMRDLKLDSIRKRMGIVTQETILFHDTVRNNIAYGLDNVKEEDLVKASEAANAMEFIKDLPNGFETVIGDRGTKLSGGQRQRLCIARAVLRNPDILIFDEATSALDNESEAKVQTAIDHLIEKRTAVVIAHRLSTIKRATRILVIDDGVITESGSHEELMAKRGTYSRLYELQFRSADL
ncbi:MAG: ABC transporter ATP-binding protein [Fibrobacteres bacterium]|nr:ABC transporter ATP-binding protein [Fibrobacterota bacterium]